MRSLLLTILVLTTACSGDGRSSPPGAPAGRDMPGDTTVHAIQGSGPTSPLNGRTVAVGGIVTGDFQDGDRDDRRNLGGFFIQGVPDADDATSDGVFVFDGAMRGPDVNVGDSVRIVGTVTEHFGETQVKASRISVVGKGDPVPVPIDLPAADTAVNSDGEQFADLERFEGMLVRFPQTLTIGSLRNLERFGEVRLSVGGRPYQFTNRNEPDSAAYEKYRTALAARTIIMDDGRRETFPRPIAYLQDARSSASVRLGNEVTGLTGNLRFSRGSGGQGAESYRLMPTERPVFVAANPRPGAPVVSGELRIALINAHNFFSVIDSGQPVCGPSKAARCRGADSAAELDRQISKLAALLAGLDADIVGIVEIENNRGGAVEMLITAANGVTERRYGYAETGVLGDDAITPALIHDVATVAPVGPPAILDSSVDARFNDDRNRPALAQTYRRLADGAQVSVVVVHLKSKGSHCDADGDPNVGDGQGNCNRTRTRAAAALADWVVTDPTGSGDPDYLIIGDFNAYVFEDPLTALKKAGYTNLVERAAGPDAYSFVFDGQAGALDHAFASSSLLPRIDDVVEWHVNADEPPALDYNLENRRDADLFDAATPYRSGDHDPLVIGLDPGN